MIYEEDTLYVDVIGQLSKDKIKVVKTRVYDIVDQFKVGSVVLSYDKSMNNDALLLDSFVREYKEKYSEKISVN